MEAIEPIIGNADKLRQAAEVLPSRRDEERCAEKIRGRVRDLASHRTLSDPPRRSTPSRFTGSIAPSLSASSHALPASARLVAPTPPLGRSGVGLPLKGAQPLCCGRPARPGSLPSAWASQKIGVPRSTLGGSIVLDRHPSRRRSLAPSRCLVPRRAARDVCFRRPPHARVRGGAAPRRTGRSCRGPYVSAVPSSSRRRWPLGSGARPEVGKGGGNNALGLRVSSTRHARGRLSDQTGGRVVASSFASSSFAGACVAWAPASPGTAPNTILGVNIRETRTPSYGSFSRAPLWLPLPFASPSERRRLRPEGCRTPLRPRIKLRPPPAPRRPRRSGRRGESGSPLPHSPRPALPESAVHRAEQRDKIERATDSPRSPTSVCKPGRTPARAHSKFITRQLRESARWAAVGAISVRVRPRYLGSPPRSSARRPAALGESGVPPALPAR